MSTIYPVVAMLSVNKQSTFLIMGHDVRLGLNSKKLFLNEPPKMFLKGGVIVSYLI